MPLPAAVVRSPLHHRNISVRGYRREDGLFDIEGALTDVKDVDLLGVSFIRKAGEPIHQMWLRITIDKDLSIVDAVAVTDAMPYAGHCDRVTADYRKLIGLSIRPGFSEKVRALFGGTAGCTHLTDLIGTLATTAFQTLAGQVARDPEKKPYQLDRCHALRTDGPAVAEFYPRWYRGSNAKTEGR
jgi:hypothetical protein